MEVIITNKDVSNLNKFMLLHSKKTKKQKIMSFYFVPFEFIIVGIIIDGLAKTAPIVTLASLFCGILWAILFPKFYNKMLQKHLNEANNLEKSEVKMQFLHENGIISFSNGEPKTSEKFDEQSISRIVSTDENYFLAFSEIHIVLPKNTDTKEQIEKISKDLNKGIEIINL